MDSQRPPTMLRNLTATVVAGTDGPTLEVALQAFFDAAGDATLVEIRRVADYKVLVISAV